MYWKLARARLQTQIQDDLGVCITYITFVFNLKFFHHLIRSFIAIVVLSLGILLMRCDALFTYVLVTFIIPRPLYVIVCGFIIIPFRLCPRTRLRSTKIFHLVWLSFFLFTSILTRPHGATRWSWGQDCCYLWIGPVGQCNFSSRATSNHMSAFLDLKEKRKLVNIPRGHIFIIYTTLFWWLKRLK